MLKFLARVLGTPISRSSVSGEKANALKSTRGHKMDSKSSWNFWLDPRFVLICSGNGGRTVIEAPSVKEESEIAKRAETFATLDLERFCNLYFEIFTTSGLGTF